MKYATWFVALAAIAGSAPGIQRADAQDVLLDETQSIAAPDAAVPVERSFLISTGGSHDVTLTDLGAASNAPLASVRVAITQGSTLIGTPLTAPGTMTFTAAANTTYTVRVVGKPGPAVGSGVFRVRVRATGSNTDVANFVDILAPPAGSQAAGRFLLDSPLNVATTGDYDVTLRDLQWPQPLSTLLLAVVEEGGPLVTNLAGGVPPAQSTVTLNANVQYRVFAIAVAPGAEAGGVYSVKVQGTGGGAVVLNRTEAVAGVAKLGSINLASGAHVLSVTDLAFPGALAQLGALLTLNGEEAVASVTAGDTNFNANAGPHDLYAFAAPAAGTGSLAVEVAPQGQAPVFGMTHVVASAASGAYAFTWESGLAAEPLRLRLADYQFPEALQSVRLALVQGHAILGTPITGAGTQDITTGPGAIHLLAFATPTAQGGLLGVDLAKVSGGSTVFETTQGVGRSFASRKLIVAANASYDVTLSDLGFPANFTNLSAAVTRGSDRVGFIYGGGTFDFPATTGNYFVNIIAQPDANEQAGTYAIHVAETQAPVVTLSASATRIAAGGTVDLTWNSQRSSSCTASGGWSGSRAASGTERSPALTANTTFTLTCAGPGGSAAQSVSIETVSGGGGGNKGGGGAFDVFWLALLALCTLASLLLRSRLAMRTVAAVSCLALLTLVGGCGGAHSRYESSMERGKAYLEKDDLDKARVEFRNAAQISPKSAEARYQAGVVAQRRGDFREALQAYKAAIDLQADYPAAGAALARVFLLAGAPDLAMEAVAPGLKKHPDDVGLLVARGTAYAQLKKPVEAHADAQRAVQLDPADESAVALLSSLLRASNDAPGARTLLEDFLKRKPDAIDTRRILANLEIESGDMMAAEAQLKETVRLKPKVLALRYELANFYVRSRDLDAAQKTLEGAVAAVPDSDAAKLELANFLATQRSREAGEATLRGLIAKEPDNPELRFGLASLLERNGADKEAIAAYEDIIRREPESPGAITARNRLAAYYASHGDVPRAEKLVAEVVNANPRDLDALVLRARMAIDKGNAAAAVVDLRTVLRDLPNSVPAYQMLARAHIANGEGALAEDALRRALEVEPANTATRIELAQMLIRTGRADASVSMLEDAVRRAPTDVLAREALLRAYIETRDYAAATRAAGDLQVMLPKSPMGYFYAGQVAQLQKNPAEAEKQYQQALTVAPDAIDTLAALSRLEIATGRGKQSIARVEGMLARGNNIAALRNLYGELLLATNQPQRAVPALEQTIRQAPRWWLPYRNLAIAKYTLKDPDGAIAAYQAGLKQVPDEISLVIDLASLYELQNRIDDAVHVYETYHAAHPAQDVVTNNLAKLLLSHRDDAGSLARAAELTAKFANAPDPALLDTYGWALFRRGDYEGARQALETAFNRAPDSGSIRYHLALVQVHSGEIRKAIDNLEIAVLSPRGFVGLAEARTLLVDLKSRAG